MKNERETLDMCQRITHAYKYASKKLYSTDIIGGVHPLPLNLVIELCEYIEIQPSDSFWEIGVGVPLLAFSLSAAAFDGVVLGTDLGKLIHNKNKL